MLRLLRAATVAARAFVFAPAAHAAPARDIAGVTIHPWRMESPQILEQTFAGIAVTGARWARVDLRWILIDADGPSLASGRADWTEVAAAGRHGIELLPIVGHVPGWTNDQNNSWGYPDGQALEDFLAAALRRYPQIGAWEIWNEPNYGRFAKPHPDPAAFVEILRRAHRAREPGRLWRKADFGRPCSRAGDRHRRLGRRDGAPWVVSSSSTDWVSIRIARWLRMIRAPG